MASKKPLKGDVIYKAREGSKLTDDQAAIIGTEIERARSAGKDLSPRRLLDVARDKRHPLHPMFQWNDKKAGESFRVDQAREFLGSVVVLEIRVNRMSRATHSVSVAVSDNEHDRVYKPRRDLDVGDYVQIGSRYFKQILAVINEVESLGMCERGAWMELLRVVRRHEADFTK